MILSFAFGQSSEPRMAFIGTDVSQLRWRKGLDEKSLEKSTSNLHPKSLTWNLKNYDFKKYNFFFWGDNFSIGQMLVFVGYISVSIVIDLAALPPHLQGRCYRQ